ncbi:hypothetical protein EW145_g6999 [Phellinidium pouzarii]|uniref:Uncharacterized protein n=1 Tax=Phellinidium pouzarii TaxID=167371 RepID=A0A4S4KSM8_9AGAM|nr:hypothetical protein EW145_g6999 [Phellinidium pouzarii]
MERKAACFALFIGLLSTELDREFSRKDDAFTDERFNLKSSDNEKADLTDGEELFDIREYLSSSNGKNTKADMLLGRTSRSMPLAVGGIDYKFYV